jgi:predicted nucleic acid-binding protein
MSSTLLVDSSVWIAHYRNKLEPGLQRIFTHALHEGRVGLAPVVWLELVVGFRGPQEREHLENIRLAARWVDLPEDIWTRAEQNAGRLHAAGVVLRLADLLILTLADATDLQLLHCDKDFDRALHLKEFARLRVNSM